jgi:phage tail-like protein
MSVRRLSIQLGAEIVQTIDLAGFKISIGKLPDNGVVLAGAHVADRHAELRQEPEGITLVHVGGTFRTLLDGVGVLPDQPYLLRDGSVIQIDLYLLTYRSDEHRATGEIHVTSAPAEPAAYPHRLARQARPTFAPSNLAPGSASSYMQYLPVIFHGAGSETINRLLLLFENLWEPLEQRLQYIDMYFDPRTCPASFLLWLASWFEVRISPHWPEARVRALLPALIELYRWRGTEYGLTQIIQVCIGMRPTITQSPSEPFVLHIACKLPEDGSADRKLLDELIQANKPAHVGYVLEAPE